MRIITDTKVIVEGEDQSSISQYSIKKQKDFNSRVEAAKNG